MSKQVTAFDIIEWERHHSAELLKIEREYLLYMFELQKLYEANAGLNDPTWEQFVKQSLYPNEFAGMNQLINTDHIDQCRVRCEALD